MIERLLLDTCACLWLTHDDPMSEASLDAIEAATQAYSVHVSAITAREVATLVRKGRFRLRTDPLSWFHSLVGLPGMSLVGLDPEVLVASVNLPGQPPKDPADRIIAATARALGLVVVTRDGELRAYAEAGHVSLIPC